MRPPVDTILAPPVPRHLRRVTPPGAATEGSEAPPQRALVVWFWDVCQPSSLRSLPYLVVWHARYAAAGLRILAVHAPGSDPGRDEDGVAAAATALDLPFEVVLDTEFELWRAYENPGWPARYVLGPGMSLVDVHFGEGDYEGAERAIQDLVGAGGPCLEPLRPEDRADALVATPTAVQPGSYDGPYAAGEVWVVVAAPGAVVVNGVRRELDRVGAHRVIAHELHTEGTVTVVPEPGTDVLTTAFAPGIARGQ
jgi:hypothetical protein